MKNENYSALDVSKKKVPWYSYLVLFLTILFLSGLFTNSTTPLKALDFANILGTFGQMGTLSEGVQESGITFANDFKGIGGTGAKDGFLLALTVGPAIILAYGVIQIYNDYKGMLAAEKLFSPILKPLLGIPGPSALGLISSLTSADAGAGVANNLYETNALNENQLAIMTSFMFSAPGILVNFFVFSAAITPYVTGQITIALAVILVMKFFGAIVCRIFLNLVDKNKGVE